MMPIVVTYKRLPIHLALDLQCLIKFSIKCMVLMLSRSSHDP